MRLGIARRIPIVSTLDRLPRLLRLSIGYNNRSKTLVRLRQVSTCNSSSTTNTAMTRRTFAEQLKMDERINISSTRTRRTNLSL